MIIMKLELEIMYGVYFSLVLIYFFWIRYVVDKSPIKKHTEREMIENKYLNELKSLEDNDLKLEKNCDELFVEESFESYGTIKMMYKLDEEKFVYYTEAPKHIPYFVLDALARKYVITHDCKNIYIDINEEVEKKKKEAQEKKIQESKSQEKIDDKKSPAIDVFATFKSYNIIKKKDKLIKEKINVFKYGGAYSNICIKQQNKGKDISFSNYKKNV